MISASVQHGHAKDIALRLQVAACVFYANRAVSCDRNVPTRPYHVTLHEWNGRFDEFVVPGFVCGIGSAVY